MPECSGRFSDHGVPTAIRRFLAVNELPRSYRIKSVVRTARVIIVRAYSNLPRFLYGEICIIGDDVSRSGIGRDQSNIGSSVIKYENAPDLPVE